MCSIFWNTYSDLERYETFNVSEHFYRRSFFKEKIRLKIVLKYIWKKKNAKPKEQKHMYSNYFHLWDQYAHHVVMDTFLNENNSKNKDLRVKSQKKWWPRRGDGFFWHSTLQTLFLKSSFAFKKASITTWWGVLVTSESRLNNI